MSRGHELGKMSRLDLIVVYLGMHKSSTGGGGVRQAEVAASWMSRDALIAKILDEEEQAWKT